MFDPEMFLLGSYPSVCSLVLPDAIVDMVVRCEVSLWAKYTNLKYVQKRITKKRFMQLNPWADLWPDSVSCRRVLYMAVSRHGLEFSSMLGVFLFPEVWLRERS